jgi:hypothetical protein
MAVHGRHEPFSKAKKVRIAPLTGLLLTLCVACSSGDSTKPQARLIAPGFTGGSSVTLSHIAYERPVTIGDLIVCLNRPGLAFLRSVTPIGAEGVQLTGVAIRKSPYFSGRQLTGEVQQSLTSAGFNPKSRSVSLVCDLSGKHATGYELAIEMRRSATGVGRLTGFTVHYTSGQGTQTLSLRFGVRLYPGTPSK